MFFIPPPPKIDIMLFEKWQGINQMRFSATCVDFKNKQLITAMIMFQTTQSCNIKICKILTEWAFVTLGPTTKTNHCSPTPLANTYLHKSTIE